MMTAFLNSRYIYKNINPTTSKDNVIIMRYIYIYTWYFDMTNNTRMETPSAQQCL